MLKENINPELLAVLIIILITGILVTTKPKHT